MIVVGGTLPQVVEFLFGGEPFGMVGVTTQWLSGLWAVALCIFPFALKRGTYFPVRPHERYVSSRSPSREVRMFPFAFMRGVYFPVRPQERYACDDGPALCRSDLMLTIFVRAAKATPRIHGMLADRLHLSTTKCRWL